MKDGRIVAACTQVLRRAACACLGGLAAVIMLRKSACVNRFAENPGYGQPGIMCSPDIVCGRVPFLMATQTWFIPLPLVICDHCVVSTITSCYEQFSPEFYW